LKKYENEFINEDKKRAIDTSIYSEHWFRCPNQKKGIDSDDTKHIIKICEMKDFIIDYVPKNSINIDDVIFVDVKKNENISKKCATELETKNKAPFDNVVCQKDSSFINTTCEKTKKNIYESYDIVTLVKDFVNILAAKYFSEYDEWIKIAMILKYTGSKISYDFYNTFVEFSKKSIDYDENSVNKYWNKLDPKKITITIGSLFEFAKKSNSSEYKRILRQVHAFRNIEISEKFICEKLKEIADLLLFVKICY
jgi:hypothetical protein